MDELEDVLEDYAELSECAAFIVMMGQLIRDHPDAPEKHLRLARAMRDRAQEFFDSADRFSERLSAL